MTRKALVEERVYKVFHLFCGIGGGALGYAAARAELADLVGSYENIGGVDNDPAAIRDYERLTKSPGTVLDLFTREDYTAFHGKPPPDDWHEATPDDLRAVAGGRYPDVLFLSPPCKSFSGLLPRKRTGEQKYQALSRLVVRGLYLALEAFAAHPPSLIIFENVPRIEQRGRELIERNIALLQSYDYAAQTTIHDCGKIAGGYARRRRFLLVARHTPTVAPFLYEPPLRPMQTLGDAILSLPLPFDPAGGPMHRLPRLNFKTWLRLALIPPGGDWRDLASWAPDTFGVERTPFNNVFRVLRTDEPAPTVTAGATPTSGGYAVADVRLTDKAERHPAQLAVADPSAPARTVTGSRLGSGGLAAVDPRLAPSTNRHTSLYHVVDPEGPARTVTGASRVMAGAPSTPDVRMSLPDTSVTLRVRRLDEPAATVPSRSSVWDSGGQAVPEPRVSDTYRNGTLGVAALDQPAMTVTASADIWSPGQGATPEPRVKRAFSGAYGVRDLDEPSGAVTGCARESTGAFSVADVRVSAARNGSHGVQRLDAAGATVTGDSWPSNGPNALAEPRPSMRPPFWPEDIPIIESPHTGCMHRPLTTLELMKLQGFLDVMGFDPEDPPVLDGTSVAAWRERIGNAVPPTAAREVANTMLRTLLANERAQQPLPTTKVWVDGDGRPLPVINQVLRWFAPDDYLPACAG